ncbi:MAG: FAD-dependent oxidoreductase [Gammaproteobacteria bacterium]|nr:FAD-dependent oxidoreductase [Gammaproteobacteria bacterium]
MPSTTIQIDTVIAGGGIAGLWLLNVLRSRGYSAVLLEAEGLGGAQTLSSQGIVHGGIKYALGGALTAASEVMSQAPARWRACLEGNGEVDLRGLVPLSDGFHLFSGAGALGRLAAFFASKALRGRVEQLHRCDYPEALRHVAFRGPVYRLQDFVLDTTALVERLGALASGNIYRHSLTPSACILNDGVRVRLADYILKANRLILAAGAGNEAVLEGLGLSGIAMQRRPLHQVMVRHPNLPPLYGHWLAGAEAAEPRLTITSHGAGSNSGPGGLLWYLGGQLATDGAGRSAQAQRDQARLELEACFPWMDWSLAKFETFRVDRAEPHQRTGLRPDHAFAEASGPCIVCWPTKLTLAPDLGDRVLSLLPPPEHLSPGPLNLPSATTGRAPWST